MRFQHALILAATMILCACAVTSPAPASAPLLRMEPYLKGLPISLYQDGALIDKGKVDEQGIVRFKHQLDAKTKYTLVLPNGQTYHIGPNPDPASPNTRPANDVDGYTNPGGSLD
jgi:hypothetical protein